MVAALDHAPVWRNFTPDHAVAGRGDATLQPRAGLHARSPVDAHAFAALQPAAAVAATVYAHALAAPAAITPAISAALWSVRSVAAVGLGEPHGLGSRQRWKGDERSGADHEGGERSKPHFR
jgi:hypothetical protein